MNNLNNYENESDPKGQSILRTIKPSKRPITHQFSKVSVIIIFILLAITFYQYNQIKQLEQKTNIEDLQNALLDVILGDTNLSTSEGSENTLQDYQK